jgi:hypothetical protein
MSNNGIYFSKGTSGGEKLGYTYNIDHYFIRNFFNIRNNVYYVDNVGKMYKHDSADISNTGTNMDYQRQKFVKGDPNIYPSFTSMSDAGDCDTDASCIGYIDTGVNKYKVLDDEFKHLRYSLPRNSNFYMKMKNINPNTFSKSFPKSVTYGMEDYYHNRLKLNYTKNAHGSDPPLDTEFKQGRFGLQYVMHGVYDKFKTERDDFQTKFNTLVNAFEQLSENEMKMLNQTNIDIKNLNKMINSYDSLMNKATKNEKIKDLVDIQERDTRLSHKNSEYSMALAGLLSIGSLMYVFSKVK